MISGEKLIIWFHTTWPMDFWATLISTFFLISFLVYWFLIRNNVNNKRKIKEFFEDVVRWTIDIITFQWLKYAFKALFYSKNGEPGLHFNLFQTMFVLCSFVVLFRLGTGGKELHGVQIGPNVMTAKQITANKTTNEARAYYSAKKVISSPLNAYEILVLLIFTGFFYWRKDLKEGDQKDGLDRFLEAGRELVHLKLRPELLKI